MTEAFQYVLLYIGTVIGVAHVYDLTYRFQIKEYRLDRFLTFIKEEGFLNAVYSRRIRFPSKSPRNMLIIALSILLLIFPAFYAQTGSLLLTALFVIGAPFISLVLVAITVLLTEIPAQIKRRGIVTKASLHLKSSKAVVIGITGSYGKTTTKEFLFQILSRRFKVAKTEGNMNTDVGIALSILKNVAQDTDYFVAEMGAYKRHEIEKACKVAPPRYGIVTAIGNQHLGLFGSMEKLLAAKKELLEAVPLKGRIYLNKAVVDRSVLVRGILAPVTLFSSASKADITAKRTEGKKYSYAITYKKSSFELKVPLDLPYAIDALLPCIALAFDLGMKEKEIKEAVGALKSISQKLTPQKGAGNSLLLIDTANSSVDGFLAALEKLGATKASKKYAVTKGIIELGAEKEASYKKILGKAAQKKTKVATTDRLFKQLDIHNNVLFFESDSKLLDHLLKIADSKSTILLEGRFHPSFVRKLKA